MIARRVLAVLGVVALAGCGISEPTVEEPDFGILPGGINWSYVLGKLQTARQDAVEIRDNWTRGALDEFAAVQPDVDNNFRTQLAGQWGVTDTLVTILDNAMADLGNELAVRQHLAELFERQAALIYAWSADIIADWRLGVAGSWRFPYGQQQSQNFLDVSWDAYLRAFQTPPHLNNASMFADFDAQQTISSLESAIDYFVGTESPVAFGSREFMSVARLYMLPQNGMTSTVALKLMAYQDDSGNIWGNLIDVMDHFYWYGDVDHGGGGCEEECW